MKQGPDLSGAWVQEEVEAIVADYFQMLHAELVGTPYSKTDHRRKLQPRLRCRSEQSIEYKHANISAILMELRFPSIPGYKPRSNYQRLLFETVVERLRANRQLQIEAAQDVDRSAIVPPIDDILAALKDPPKAVTLKNRISEPMAPYFRPPVDYLEREARNRDLGLAGEEFVIKFERARLVHAGKENLARRIEHVSKERGDGAGFDVLSFEANGAERLIEVKTTKYGAHTPFFVSRNEVEVSSREAHQYHLYRVFEFRVRPFVFVLPGSLSATCSLDPSTFVARVA